jgi:hypothetical protein
MCGYKELKNAGGNLTFQNVILVFSFSPSWLQDRLDGKSPRGPIFLRSGAIGSGLKKGLVGLRIAWTNMVRCFSPCSASLLMFHKENMSISIKKTQHNDPPRLRVTKILEVQRPLVMLQPLIQRMGSPLMAHLPSPPTIPPAPSKIPQQALEIWRWRKGKSQKRVFI